MAKYLALFTCPLLQWEKSLQKVLELRAEAAAAVLTVISEQYISAPDFWLASSCLHVASEYMYCLPALHASFFSFNLAKASSVIDYYSIFKILVIKKMLWIILEHKILCLSEIRDLLLHITETSKSSNLSLFFPIIVLKIDW